MWPFGLLLLYVYTVASQAPSDEACEGAATASSGLLQSKVIKALSLEHTHEEDLVDPLSLKEQGNQSNDLAAHCTPKSRKPAAPKSAKHAEMAAIAQDMIKQKQKQQVMGETLSCDGITLVEYGVTTKNTSCCPSDSIKCAGCAMYDTVAESCKKCQGGYIMQDGLCVACEDTVGWVTKEGATCDSLSGAMCNDRPVNGESSKQACCKCGGGKKLATPFQYADKRYAMGGDIDMVPLPRTATRYSVNSACEFSAHNITMNGSTGHISYAPGKDPPQKPFGVACEVTAHQAAGLSETVKVAVNVDWFTYGASVLVFSPSTVGFSPETDQGTWQEYGMVCTPEAPWLVQKIATGALTADGNGTGGAVTEVDDSLGMDGALCQASAIQLVGTPGEERRERRLSNFVAIRPRPWPQMEYENSYVEVVTGEELPPIKLKTPPGYEEGMGGLKPSQIHLACRVEAESYNGVTNPHYHFDSLINMGLLGSHHIFEVDQHGSIIVAPAESMAKIFDDVDAEVLKRKSLLVRCGVWGTFPGTPFPPLYTSLVIKIKDSMCWVQEKFRGTVVATQTAQNAASCRNLCRGLKTCSHYKHDANKDDQGPCKMYRMDTEGGAPVTATAKVTDCSDLNTCIRLKHSRWVISGDYCPVAYDFARGGPVYRKSSSIPEEVLYLATVPKGSLSTCGEGNWLVQLASPDTDFIDEKMGYFELKGSEEMCLKASLPSTDIIFGNAAQAPQGQWNLIYATGTYAPLPAALLEDELEDVPLDVGSSEDGDGEWEMEDQETSTEEDQEDHEASHPQRIKRTMKVPKGLR